MSHGGSEDSGEPNLTPLLDMVLQLVMFFMMVANFTMEEVNADIKLPVALSAKAMDKSEMEDVLYLNINQDGHMVVAGRPKPLVTPADIDDFLSEKKGEFLSKAKANGDTSGKLGPRDVCHRPGRRQLANRHGDVLYAIVPADTCLRRARGLALGGPSSFLLVRGGRLR